MPPDSIALLLRVQAAGIIRSSFWRDAPGWSLQQNGDLMMLAVWSLNNNATLSGGTNYLMLSNAPGIQFYRLNHP